MTKTQLIEEIKNHYGGTPHESVMDEIYDMDIEELKFFLWRLNNGWYAYESNENFIHLRTLQVLSADQLLEKYEADKSHLHPLIQKLINILP